MRMSPEPVVVVEVLGNGMRALAVGAAHDLLKFVEELSAAVFLFAERGLTKAAIFIGGHAGVEDEGLVALQGHAALADDEEHVFPKAVAGNEGLAETGEAGLFFFAEGVGVGRVDGGEVVIFERVDFAIERDASFFIVDMMKKAAVIHVPFGMTFDDGGGDL